MKVVTRRRKALVQTILPISQIFVGIGGGTLALKWVQPTEEMRVTALRFEATLGVGRKSTFLGQTIAKTSGLTLDLDVKAPDNDEYPEAFSDIQNIFGIDTAGNTRPITSKEALQKINEIYGEEAQKLMLKLLAKSTATFTFGFVLGNYLAEKAIRKLKNETQLDSLPNQSHFIKSIAIAVAMATVIQTINYKDIDKEEFLFQLENAINQPIEQYLLTGTSKAAANMDSISREVSLNVARLLKIQRDLQNGAESVEKNADNQVNYLIVSDLHNLPTAPKEIESILRAVGADGLIYLGDFLNNGAQYEVDALSGITLGDTKFQGLDDIRQCTAYDAMLKCIAEGNPFPAFALSGNHDTSTLMDNLATLGIKNLEDTKPPGLENTFALRDACYINQKECLGDYKDDEKAFGEQALNEFLEKYPDPDSRPKIGFFASKEAAEVFINEGIFETIIYGGDHLFSVRTTNGTKVIGVGTAGAGGPRGADYSNAISVSFNLEPNIPEEKATLTLGTGISPTLSDCTRIDWDEFLPGRESIEPCFP